MQQEHEEQRAKAERLNPSVRDQVVLNFDRELTFEALS